jgi:tetratricopeptide (TPR) repeat protein
MKKIVIILTALSVMIGISLSFFSNQPIVDPEDYLRFLNPDIVASESESLNKEINFWLLKLQESPKNHVFEKKLAGVLARRFKQNGKLGDLLASDSLLKGINQRIPGQTAVLHSLTANAITQHQFLDAQNYGTEALEIGEKRFISSLFLVDVLLERGQTKTVENQLKQLIGDHQFDYLIRDVKYQDQTGDLQTAIRQLEKALALARSSGNKNQINWTLSNLGDMYGHDGRIQQSYDAYLEALKWNPADFHSLKGIAWIAFSNDQNIDAAKQIVHFLQEIHSVPDYALLLADIAHFEGDHQKAERLEQQFMAATNHPVHQVMYRTYRAELSSSTPEAIQWAKEEIKERPHPLSYDLLAWSLFRNGRMKEALAITTNQVLNQTSEPLALYHSGIILLEAGQTELAEEILSKASEAAFELGPLMAETIQGALARIKNKDLASMSY